MNSEKTGAWLAVGVALILAVALLVTVSSRESIGRDVRNQSLENKVLNLRLQERLEVISDCLQRANVRALEKKAIDPRADLRDEPSCAADLVSLKADLQVAEAKMAEARGED